MLQSQSRIRISFLNHHATEENEKRGRVCHQMIQDSSYVEFVPCNACARFVIYFKKKINLTCVSTLLFLLLVNLFLRFLSSRRLLRKYTNDFSTCINEIFIYRRFNERDARETHTHTYTRVHIATTQPCHGIQSSNLTLHKLPTDKTASVLYHPDGARRLNL